MKSHDVIDPRYPHPPKPKTKADVATQMLREIASSNREILRHVEKQSKLIASCRAAAWILILVLLACIIGFFAGVDESGLDFVNDWFRR